MPTVVELKAVLAARGLVTTGRKAALEARLAADHCGNYYRGETEGAATRYKTINTVMLQCVCSCTSRPFALLRLNQSLNTNERDEA